MQTEQDPRDEREEESLPQRNPGTHWTGPSGEHRHVEVPLSGRTLTNIRNWQRLVT